ncbi:MAG: hypothetical protein V3V99_05315 [candidate division Zixibacteria bacterium]
MMAAKILTTNFTADFIQRTLRTTGIVLIITFLLGLYYFGLYDSLAYLSAGIWSMLNLIFLAALVRMALRPDKIDKLAVAGLALIKFPLLYGTGYFLFTVEIFRPIPLFIGLSIVLLIMSLKALSRAMLKLDFVNQEDSSRGVA